MAGLFNRLKGRKTGVNNEGESGISSLSFDEEGFLCPLCRQKFPDHTQLARHYTDAHEEQPVVEANIIQQKEILKDPIQEIARWKEQFSASEESRILLSNALMQEKQHTNDLEEELLMIQKHLKTTQSKVAEQTQEIANFKATKDVYDAQLTIFSGELLNAQNLLKEKQQQIDTLLSQSSNDDDVSVLQRELLTIQLRMNEVSIEKEEQIEKLHSALRENDQYLQRLDRIGTIFHQNLAIYEEMISKNTLQVANEMNRIKQLVQLTRERKKKVQNGMKSMRNRLVENRQLKQTTIDLEQQKKSSDQLITDLQKQTNSSRQEIDTLNEEVHQLETNLNELKEEKAQLIQSKMLGDEDNERQNLLRQITNEKNQYEQQIKEYRIQIKQISNERQSIREEFERQVSLVSNEKEEISRLNHQVDSLKKQLVQNNQEKERRINDLTREFSAKCEQSISVENNLRETNDNQKRELERLKSDFTEQINRLTQEKTDFQQAVNRTKTELTIMQKEKDAIVQQLQTKLAQLHAKLDEREKRIKRLSFGIHRSITLARKTRDDMQQINQLSLLTTIEKVIEETRVTRTQTLEQLQEEFTTYLSIVHAIILDSKNSLANQIENDNLNRLEQQEQAKKLKEEYEKLLEEHREQNQKLGEVSKSLSTSTQTADRQREKYEKQIVSFEHELESRTKRHEMQLAALTENLASVRSELKLNNEKLASIEQIKAEKADIEGRLAVSQDERRVLLERSLANESKNEKLIIDNGVLHKKLTELESALQEIAREYQVLQIQTNKLTERRWLEDEDVDTCLKCHQIFSVTQRKHHCRSCGNIFCDHCSSKTAIVGAASKKQQRVCDQCYNDLTC